MDDNLHYRIPSSNQPVGASFTPETSTESSGFNSTDAVYNSANIRAMTEDLHYDQAGYFDAMAGKVVGQAPKTIRQLVGEASQTLASMEKDNDWNEQIGSRLAIRQAKAIAANLQAWRNSRSTPEQSAPAERTRRFGKIFSSPSVIPFKRVSTVRDLIRQEAQIGGKLFGSVPAGGARQFFYLDNHSWIWHEERLNEFGQRQALTTRYEVRETGLLKIQDGQPYHLVDDQESNNVFTAIKLYYREVMREVYGQQVNIPIMNEDSRFLQAA